MKLIVAVDKEWGIGRSNGLLFHLKEDMRFFKRTTTGKTVVMGSNTLLSFPGSKPLPDRKNIVLFPGGRRDDCTVCQTLAEIAEAINGCDTDDVYVIGGAMFYHTMLPYCDEALITKVDAVGGATVFFDNLDEKENWECVSVGEPIVDGEYTIRFTVYKNHDVKKLN